MGIGKKFSFHFAVETESISSVLYFNLETFACFYEGVNVFSTDRNFDFCYEFCFKFFRVECRLPTDGVKQVSNHE